VTSLEEEQPISDAEGEGEGYNGDFEPIDESAEGYVESDLPEDEEQADEELEGAMSDESGPDRDTPFDPSVPGGVPHEHWPVRNSPTLGGRPVGVISPDLGVFEERIRAASASRIPIRVPNTVATVSPEPGSPPSPIPLVEPPQIPRYVHGAPLHNLIETEEEED